MESGEILFSELDTVETCNVLRPGSYNLSYAEYPKNSVIIKQDFDTESPKIYDFPDKSKVDNLFESFFNSDVISKIEKLGFNHKLGLLFYGKEGTGKSTIMKHYYTKFINDKNAVVFYIDCFNHRIVDLWDFISSIRRIQDNTIIIIFDEFDCQMKDNEAYIKRILDGAISINNCIFMASTNYINEIPEAIKNRPSRFKYSLDIEGIQNFNEVFNLVASMIGDLFDKESLECFSNELKGNTLDYIKQFCLDKIMNIENHEVIKRKKKLGFLVK